jgi:Family of unknown function (DUF5689)
MKSVYVKSVSVLFSMSMILSCLSDDSYEVPKGEPTVLDIPPEQIITINALRSAWAQEVSNNGNAILTFSDDNEEKHVEGYVVSSDESGNYFEEIILQDRPEDPTTGLKLLIDSSPLYGRYNIGRKLYVELKGLSVGLDSGVFSIGIDNAGSLSPIAEASMDDKIKRDTLIVDMIPSPLSFSEFSFDKTNIFARLTDVQFHRNEVSGNNPLTYAGEPEDQYDGERTLESCLNGQTLLFSTSTFSTFKSQELARGKGSIDGILLYDFFGEHLIFKVNTLNDINLTDEDRCDPEFFTCDSSGSGQDIIWSENFEDGNTIESYENAGWTNSNLEGGTTKWLLGNFDGNNYVQITGFNSGESPIRSWLITPEINLDSSEKEELKLNIQTSYNTGIALGLYFSNDFNGDISMATWQPLDMYIPNGPSGGFGTFQTVGPINLSCIEGDFHLGFLYEGSDPDLTTRYHLDAITITGEE